MAITPERVSQISDEQSLYEFLASELDWPIHRTPDTFEFFADELGLTDAEARQIRGVRQIANFEKGQPWGIFLVEFDGERGVYQTALRRVLRGLSETRRDRDASLPAWKAEDLLFICTPNYRDFTFAHFQGRTHTQATLTRFGWNYGDTALRTLCTENLAKLRYPSNTDYTQNWRTAWASAFDVEQVTARFYDTYREVFHQVESGMVKGVQGDRWLFTQRLFNRLMFIQFLSKRGWLKFQGSTDYLNALWRGRKQGQNFYRTHLVPLFFVGMNQKFVWREKLDVHELIGEVPYLNGGLFQKFDDEGNDVVIEDRAFDLIFNRLFNRFNFTVEESTPLDVQVAVDPEMLGKVFEELVTGRHESGSYYTPRPVVAFMCKEALKGYLGGGEKITVLVDRHDVSGIDVPTARGLLRQLEEFRCVDPACGSGAYLLGMLQELFALNRLLDTRANTDRDDYRRKLAIIQNNLYGVDREEFAISIARLRLWLSLVVEYTGNTPEPLPNLDFKIERGDSILGPDPQGGPQPDMFRQKDIDDYERMKEQFGNPYFTGDKTVLMQQIQALEQSIADWAHPQGGVIGFDWKVKFAEIFRPREPLTTIDGAMNFGQSLADTPRKPGFDAVLANPPYVRHQLISNKDNLRKQYPEATSGTSDLYCYFYARALQLLRPGGLHIFICSGTWLDVGFGGKLQKYLIDNADIVAVYDSLVEKQFSTADVNTVISVLRKKSLSSSSQGSATRFISFTSPFHEAANNPKTQRVIEIDTEELITNGQDEKGNYKGDSWGGKYLRAPQVFFDLLNHEKMIRLRRLATARLGVTTGANEFFFLRKVDRGTYQATLEGVEHIVEIPDCYVYPVIRTSSEWKEHTFLSKHTDYRLLCVDQSCQDKQVLRYIRIGEAVGINRRPFFKNKKCWFEIKNPVQDSIAVSEIIYRRYGFLWNPDKCVLNKNFYGIYSDTDPDLLFGLLNFTFSFLFFEVCSRKPGAGASGIGVRVANKMPIVDPSILSSLDCDLIREASFSIRNRAVEDIAREVTQADRRTLDEAFLNALNLPRDTQERLYEALLNLVEQRVLKAQANTSAS